MQYLISDIHGEYGAFCALLEHIGFGADDELTVCGDLIDKGDGSVAVLRRVAESSNMHAIVGNHELAFLKYYWAEMERTEDFDDVLAKLREYLSGDGAELTWELVDFVESLPLYRRVGAVLCVHAGIPVLSDGTLADVSQVSAEELVFDRRFKERSVRHVSPTCVAYGHTPTKYLCPEGGILLYSRQSAPPRRVEDCYKLHLDTGAYLTGMLGCLCVDTMERHYVDRHSQTAYTVAPDGTVLCTQPIRL